MSDVVKDFARKTFADCYSGPLEEERGVKEPIKTNDCENSSVEPHSIERLRALHEKAVAGKDRDMINNIIRDVNTQMLHLARRGEDLTFTISDIEERLASQICTSFNKSGYVADRICENSDKCIITIVVPKIEE